MTSPFCLSDPVDLGMGRVICPLTAADAATIGTASAKMDPYLRLGYSPVALSTYLQKDDPGLHRFRIEVNGEPAGVLALRHPWLRGPFVEMLAVLPEGQGQGVGKAAIAWALRHAKGHAANFWATVSDFNKAGRAFWATMGFTEVCSLPGLVESESAEILLRRQI